MADGPPPASTLTKADDGLSACHSGGAAPPAAARVGVELSQQVKRKRLTKRKTEVHEHHLRNVDRRDV